MQVVNMQTAYRVCRVTLTHRSLLAGWWWWWCCYFKESYFCEVRQPVWVLLQSDLHNRTETLSVQECVMCIKMVQVMHCEDVGMLFVFLSVSFSPRFLVAIISQTKPPTFPNQYPSAKRNRRHTAHCLHCLWDYLNLILTHSHHCHTLCGCV